jgi:hypothetical protein
MLVATSARGRLELHDVSDSVLGDNQFRWHVRTPDGRTVGSIRGSEQHARNWLRRLDETSYGFVRPGFQRAGAYVSLTDYDQVVDELADLKALAQAMVEEVDARIGKNKRVGKKINDMADLLDTWLIDHKSEE